ncbi:MAG: thiamine pyrophosphate-dependent enzyme [Phycisphaerae bacterium]|nr:thiamine pyrophosphate-dependent enzyme [Phycisphaerae bacterium]
MRLVMQAAGKNIIVTSATGCSEIFTSRYPMSSWNVPWIHSLFENSSAVASGIYYGLKSTGRLGDTKIIGTGGDGGTADIGLQCLSGAFERGDDMLYVCWDNEAYMNTGVQRSGLTPLDAHTTTSPAGKVSFGNDRPKKDLPAIMAAHNIPYVGVGSCGYYREIPRMVKKALSISGPKFLQIHAVCPLGWRTDPAKTAEVARLAFETGMYPLYEIINDEVKARRAPQDGWKPVEQYLKLQGRFRHLFRSDEGKEHVARIQQYANDNIRRFYGAGAVPEFENEGVACNA